MKRFDLIFLLYKDIFSPFELESNTHINIHTPHKHTQMKIKL